MEVRKRIKALVKSLKKRLSSIKQKIVAAATSKLATLLLGVLLGVGGVLGVNKGLAYLESLKTPHLDAYEAEIRSRVPSSKELEECFFPRVRKEIGEQKFAEAEANPIIGMFLNMELSNIARECKLQ